MLRVEGLQVGTVEELASGSGAAFRTGIRKGPVRRRVRLTTLGLEGDEQADRHHHGGPDKAVLCSALSHYAAWRTELGRPEMGPGGFGENLSLPMTEEDVAIGDRLRVGTAVCEVSQPRIPCWKQAARWDVPDLVLRMRRSGRTGWYLRVLEEGYVWPFAPLEVLARPYAGWTVARLNELLRSGSGEAEVRGIAECPVLAVAFRRELLRTPAPMRPHGGAPEGAD